MKTKILFIRQIQTVCILLVSSFTLYAETNKTIIPKLQKVTVYIQGAHLYYNENVSLQAGNIEIIFENISPYLLESSLQANCKGAVVMDIKHNVKYKEKVEATRKYDKTIENVLDSLEEEL